MARLRPKTAKCFVRHTIEQKGIGKQGNRKTKEGDIPNPHIKPFPAPAIEKQLEKLHQFKISESDLSDGETMEKIDNQLIRKLEIWINKTVRFSDHGPKDEMFKTFREIRGLRSKSARSHFKNEWNLRFYEDQKKLIKQTYTAIRTLRLILANHNLAKMVEVPEWLFKGKIRTF